MGWINKCGKGTHPDFKEDKCPLCVKQEAEFKKNIPYIIVFIVGITAVFLIPVFGGGCNKPQIEEKNLDISIKDEGNYELNIGEDGDFTKLEMNKSGNLTVRLLHPNPHYRWHFKERVPGVRIYAVKDIPTINGLGDSIMLTEFSLRVHPPTRIIFEYYREDKVIRSYKVDIGKQNSDGSTEKP